MEETRYRAITDSQKAFLKWLLLNNKKRRVHLSGDWPKVINRLITNPTANRDRGYLINGPISKGLNKIRREYIENYMNDRER